MAVAVAAATSWVGDAVRAFQQVLPFVLVGLFGAAVGTCEIIARYRDAPIRAVRTRAAMTYISVNAIAAAAAWLLIVEFDWSFGASPSTKVLVQIMVAGFGAMIFFRSSLFNMKIGDTDVAVGPGILFQTLLHASDRECDRERASPRSKLVSDIMQGVSFEQAKDALPAFCFELMQNVDLAEQEQFRQTIRALSASPMRDSIKVLNLGLMLMNVVGAQVLGAAVQSLGVRIQGPAKLELDVFTRLQQADFSLAYPLLVDVCIITSQFGTGKDHEKWKEDILKECGSLQNNMAVDNGAKMTLLGLALQQRVGDSVLLAALVQTANSIKLGPARPQPQSQAGVVPIKPAAS